MLISLLFILIAGALGIWVLRRFRVQSAGQLKDAQDQQGWALLCQFEPAPLVLITQQGQIVAHSRAASLWLGMDGQVGQSLWDLFAAPIVQQLSAVCTKNADAVPATFKDVSIVGAGFSRIAVDLHLAPLAPSAALWVVKMSQQQVQQAAQVHDLVVDSVKETLLNSNISAIIAVNEQDRIVEFNPCAERLFGHQRQDVLGQTMADLIIPPSFRAMHYAGMRRFIQTGASSIMYKRVEVTAQNASGQEFPIEIEVAPARQADGWLFVAVIQDISERVQSVEKVRQALADAQAANQAKSRFLTSVSHEIRTPLHAMLGLLECLQHTALNDQQLQYTHLAQTAGGNLLNMINDVLDLGRIEAGKREVHTSVFNPQVLLQEHLGIYHHRMTEKGLSLYTVDAPTTPRRLSSDITIVRQILTNLLSNAYQYTEHGAIVIRTWYEARSISSGYWCCQFKDTGVGLSPEQLAQLFEEFSRFHPVNSGTGVGLMICQHLTKLLNGRLDVESIQGQGSAFTLRLPAMVGREPRRWRLLTTLTVYVLGHCPHWLNSLTEQLRNIGVAQIEVIGERELAQLPASSIVMVAPDGLACHDDETWYERTPIPPSLKFISTGVDVARFWLHHPQHFAFVREPLWRHDLLWALRAAVQNKPRRMSLLYAPVASTAVIKPSTARAYHVLLVDDSEVNRLTIKTFLGMEGIRVTEAVDGVAAIAAVTQQRFDLILMDVRMPVMGGIEAVEKIRQNQLAEHTPIIALTAHVQDEEKQRCLQVGMQDFLTKPIGKAMLIKRVMQWLNPAVTVVEAAEPPVAVPTEQGEFAAYPLIDDEHLAQFQAELSAENYQQLVAIFLKESTRQIDDALQFVDQNKFDRVEILVHALKSSALTFGAVRLSHVAKAAELACRQQQISKAADYCRQLKLLGEQTHAEFARR